MNIKNIRLILFCDNNKSLPLQFFMTLLLTCWKWHILFYYNSITNQQQRNWKQKGTIASSCGSQFMFSATFCYSFFDFFLLPNHFGESFFLLICKLLYSRFFRQKCWFFCWWENSFAICYASNQFMNFNKTTSKNKKKKRVLKSLGEIFHGFSFFFILDWTKSFVFLFFPKFIHLIHFLEQKHTWCYFIFAYISASSVSFFWFMSLLSKSILKIVFTIANSCVAVDICFVDVDRMYNCFVSFLFQRCQIQ